MVVHIRDGSVKAIIVIGAYRGSSITCLLLKNTAMIAINETNTILIITLY